VVLHELMVWGSGYPSVRRTLIRLWRRAARVQRATLANAVLVVRDEKGHVLVLPSSPRLCGFRSDSSTLGTPLPHKSSSGWQT
jgi:hypothetical protein